MHKIGIVILNYNSYEDTIALVEALQGQSVAQDLFFVIVDNASPNLSYEKLKPLERSYERLVVLQTGGNLGYAKGNNYGLNYLDAHVRPEYVAILNNDIILPDDCFEKLVERYRHLERPGVIAPLQLMNGKPVGMGVLGIAVYFKAQFCIVVLWSD